MAEQNYTKRNNHKHQQGASQQPHSSSPQSLVVEAIGDELQGLVGVYEQRERDTYILHNEKQELQTILSRKHGYWTFKLEGKSYISAKSVDPSPSPIFTQWMVKTRTGRNKRGPKFRIDTTLRVSIKHDDTSESMEEMLSDLRFRVKGKIRSNPKSWLRKKVAKSEGQIESLMRTLGMDIHEQCAFLETAEAAMERAAMNSLNEHRAKLEARAKELKAKCTYIEKFLIPELVHELHGHDAPSQIPEELPCKLEQRSKVLESIGEDLKKQVEEAKAKVVDLKAKSEAFAVRLGIPPSKLQFLDEILLSKSQGRAAADDEECKQIEKAKTGILQVVWEHGAVVRSSEQLSSENIGKLVKGQLVEFDEEHQVPPANDSAVEVTRYHTVPTAEFPKGGWVSNKSCLKHNQFQIVQVLGDGLPSSQQIPLRAVHPVELEKLKLADPSALHTYQTMLKVGLSKEAVAHKMARIESAELISQFLGDRSSCETRASDSTLVSSESFLLGKPLTEQVSLVEGIHEKLLEQVEAIVPKFARIASMINDIQTRMKCLSSDIDDTKKHWSNGEGTANDLTEFALKRAEERLTKAREDLRNYYINPKPDIFEFADDADY